MKKDKLKTLDPAEMQNKLREIDEQSFRVKFQMSMGQTEGLKRLRENRKDRARLLTWIRQGELRATGVRSSGVRANNPGGAK
jgi:large subunit ribosomal protein L29